MFKYYLLFEKDNKSEYKGINSLKELKNILNTSKKNILFIRQLNSQIIDFLIDFFKVNPNIFEDFEDEERNKIELLGNYTFLLFLDLKKTIDRKRKIGIIWFPNTIIVFGSRQLFENARKEFLLFKEPFKNMELFIWNLLENILKNYEEIVEILEDELEDIEEKIFKIQDMNLLEDISDISSDVINLRRLLKQLRGTLGTILHLDERFIKKRNIHYFRDLYDESINLFDKVEGLHDFVNNVINIFETMVSFKLNDMMKTLTLFMSLLAPATLISSIYGMNLSHLPFANTKYDFLIVMLIILSSFTLGLLYFRRKGWL